MCTQNQAKDILREVYQQCSTRFPCGVQDAYLYGSYARGDFHAESDVDILLTVDSDDVSSLRKIAAAVSSDLSLKHDVTVSISLKARRAGSRRNSQSLPLFTGVVMQ
jgi:predicted nucleotidyltransferase